MFERVAKYAEKIFLRLKTVLPKKSKKSRKGSNAPMPIVFYFSIFMLCLFVVSSHLTGGLFAKYMTYDAAGDDARVAKFEIVDGLSTYGENISIALDTPGKPVTLSVQLQNKSEVTVSYTVKATKITDNLTIDFSVGGHKENVKKGSETQIVSSVLPPNMDSPISMDISVILSENTDPNRAGMPELIEIVVVTEQVD